MSLKMPWKRPSPFNLAANPHGFAWMEKMEFCKSAHKQFGRNVGVQQRSHHRRLEEVPQGDDEGKLDCQQVADLGNKQLGGN